MIWNNDTLLNVEFWESSKKTIWKFTWISQLSSRTLIWIPISWSVVTNRWNTGPWSSSLPRTTPKKRTPFQKSCRASKVNLFFIASILLTFKQNIFRFYVQRRLYKISFKSKYIQHTNLKIIIDWWNKTPNQGTNLGSISILRQKYKKNLEYISEKPFVLTSTPTVSAFSEKFSNVMVGYNTGQIGKSTEPKFIWFIF